MGVYQHVTVWSGTTGTPYYTVINFHDAVSSQANANAANTKVLNFWAAATARITNLLTFAAETTVNEYNLDGTLAAFWTTAGFTGAGSAVGDRLPPATSGLLRLETGTVLSGRKLRGRIFLPGPPETDNVTAGVPQGAYQTTWNTAFAALDAAGAPELVVWSRRYAAVASVTSGATQPRWAVLRSRRD